MNGELGALATRAHSTLQGSLELPSAFAEVPRTRFSAFDDAQLREAVTLANRLWDEADRIGGVEGVRWALDEVDRLLESGAQPSGLVKYALQLLMTHHPIARQMGMPTLVEIQPAAAEARAAARAHALDEPEDLEAQLWFIREDELANEHHWHWHRVYPARRENAAAFPPAERQNELFVYMHEQMLARYDTERVALGLEPVAPFDDFGAAIEGYVSTVDGYGSRPPGRRLGDAAIASLTARHEEIVATLQDPRFDAADEASRIESINAIGRLIEATFTQTDPPERRGLHNTGHNQFAQLSDATGGVMRATTQAIRDPIFWRWHRQIDNYAFEWQERFRAGQDLADGAAEVEIADVILCLRRDIPDGEDLSEWGERTFGGERFDDAAGPPAADELLTRMVETTRTVDRIDPETGAVSQVQIVEEHLEHEEYAMFARLRNPRGRPQDVTLRVFLAATDLCDQRRFWIELDKFHVFVDPNARMVVGRGAWESSVARKPATMSGQPPPLPPEPSERNYCECGWPYSLMLPRGTADGMPFKLAVIATDGGRDTVTGHDRCGSQSFCGVRTRRYPDTRPMGYPFDLPFPGGVLVSLAARPNVALRDLTIRLA